MAGSTIIPRPMRTPTGAPGGSQPHGPDDVLQRRRRIPITHPRHHTPDMPPPRGSRCNAPWYDQRRPPGLTFPSSDSLCARKKQKRNRKEKEEGCGLQVRGRVGNFIPPSKVLLIYAHRCLSVVLMRAPHPLGPMSHSSTGR